MQRLIGYRQPSPSLNYVAECQSPADSVLHEEFDVLIPGAHGHAMNPTVDGARMSDAELADQLKYYAAKKAQAVMDDDLELALHCKRAIAVLQRPRN
jgi:hypothetical protein